MKTWIRFSQSTGAFSYIGDGNIIFPIGVGWAGNGPGKNNPDMQDVHDVGPLPRGLYDIGDPENNPHTGPYSLRLTPHPENEMFGRSDFLIHGPALDPSRFGQESKGCAILVRPDRERIVSTGAKTLEVTQ